LQLDVTTDVSNCTQLHFCSVCASQWNKTEFLFCEPLKKTMKAADIMAMVNRFFYSNSLSWDLVEAICTDGAVAILGEKIQDSQLLSRRWIQMQFLVIVFFINMFWIQWLFILNCKMRWKLSSRVSLVLSNGTDSPCVQSAARRGLVWTHCTSASHRSLLVTKRNSSDSGFELWDLSEKFLHKKEFEFIYVL
jgi:hypothetical protein